MKTILMAVVSVLAMASAFAEDAKPSEGKAKMKVRRADPAVRENILKRTGGRIEKPGSQRGKIAFINTQQEAPAKWFEDLASAYTKISGFNFVYESAAVGEPEALKALSKADVAVIIVADDKTPVMLAAMEDRWAVVNVRKLAAGFGSDEAKEKFLPGRCQKEVLRAFAAVGGGFKSQYPNNIIDIHRIPDLDPCRVIIPNDTMQGIRKMLETLDVTPITKATYRMACEQGWAPQPTNDYQKAIWEEVYTMPDKPIKIQKTK